MTVAAERKREEQHDGIEQCSRCQGRLADGSIESDDSDDRKCHEKHGRAQEQSGQLKVEQQCEMGITCCGNTSSQQVR